MITSEPAYCSIAASRIYLKIYMALCGSFVAASGATHISHESRGLPVTFVIYNLVAKLVKFGRNLLLIFEIHKMTSNFSHV